MPETKRPEAIGTPSVVKTQLLGLARACNEKKTKTRSIVEYDTVFDKLINECNSLDSGLTKAMLLIYGRPDVSSIDIPNLDPVKDVNMIMELNLLINEEKIKEAIGLIEEAMADESKVEFPGTKGVSVQAIEDIRKPIADFKSVWERHLANQEEKEKNQSIEDLNSKRTRLSESREASMEKVERHDEQLAKIDADIEKLTGEMKEKLAEIIPFPEKPAEVARITTKEEAVVASILKDELHEEIIAEKIAANSEVVDKYLDQIMQEGDVEQLVILRELQKRVKVPKGGLKLVKGAEPPDEAA